MYVARGLGSCLGLWWGGKAMDTIGPRIMYRVSSSVCLLGSAVFAIVLLLLRSPPLRDQQVLPTRDLDEEGASDALQSEIEMPVAEQVSSDNLS